MSLHNLTSLTAPNLACWLFFLPSHSIERKKANKTTVNAKAEKAGEETMAMTGLNQGTPTIPHIFFAVFLVPLFLRMPSKTWHFRRMNYCLNEPWHFDIQTPQLHLSVVHDLKLHYK